MRIPVTKISDIGESTKIRCKHKSSDRKLKCILVSSLRLDNSVSTLRCTFSYNLLPYSNEKQTMKLTILICGYIVGKRHSPGLSMYRRVADGYRPQKPLQRVTFSREKRHNYNNDRPSMG